MGSTREQHAFTLVELLVAVAIIALLAGIAFPAYRWIVKSSEASVCKSNLAQIGSALSLYLSDHNLRLPELAVGRDSIEDESTPTIDTLLMPYASSRDVFLCPGDHEGIGERTGTSYLWNHLLNGQRLDNMSFFGIRDDPKRIPVIADKEGFHEAEEVKANILYGDFHIEADVKFSTDGP
jgi:prepilin-type N-terminal cleavage/methylation domain-containing protein